MTQSGLSSVRDDYQVDVGIFHGPLDLLLYLIRKEEVDIYDIPIARITKQYLKYLELMTTFNLEVAGEFILMAATLIRIKTRMLLPRDETNSDEPDPREELIWALIEYKKYKEAGEILREKALLEERNFVPPSPVGSIENRIDWTPATDLFDLLTAFKEVLTSHSDETYHQVEAEKVSVEDRMQYIMLSLQQRKFATFAELFADLPAKIVAVVTFVALLELARTRRVAIEQTRLFSELRIYRGDAFDTWSPPGETETHPEMESEVVA